MSSVNLVLKQTLNITCMKSDTFRLEMQWLDGNGDPIDLTDYTFKSQVKKRTTSNDFVLEFTDSDFTKDALGNLTMYKVAADMDISSDNYYYDIQATNTTSGDVFTWLGGLFVIQEDITE
jgi:hypothetical protein